MSEETKDESPWRKVTGAAGFGNGTNIIKVWLECEHTVLLRVDTPTGKSWCQTEIKQMKCHQCEDEPWNC